MSVFTIRNFINGEFVPSEAHIPSENPATGKVETLVPDSDPEDAVRAIKAAKAAFKGLVRCDSILCLLKAEL